VVPADGAAESMPLVTATEADRATPPAQEVRKPTIESLALKAPDRLAPGDTFTATWSAQADDVALCYDVFAEQTKPTVPLVFSGSCVGNLPSSGSQTLTLAPIDGISRTYVVDVYLVAMNGVPDGQGGYRDPETTEQHLTWPTVCADDWFFDVPTKWCPDHRARRPEAVAQRFEHGLMIWHAGNPPTVYVLADVAAEDIGAPGASRLFTFYNPPQTKPDPSLQPPAGAFLPDSHLTHAWQASGYDKQSGETTWTIQNIMGWPTGEAVAYTGAYQCIRTTDLWDDPCFILGLDGDGYRLDGSDSVWTPLEP
jgi:hypothetical protein